MTARAAAAALAALAWTSLLLQLLLTVRLSQANGNGVVAGFLLYLSYFTVLTNLFVALLATSGARLPDGGRALAWRGCAVTAIVVVGLGYHLLLRNVWDPQGWQTLADIPLHYAVPLAALLWWLALPPHGRIASSAPLRWLAWPLAYSIFALLRGEVVGSYPYYFIDVGALGMPRVLAHLAGLLVVFVVVGHLVRLMALARQARTPSQATP